MSIADKLTTIAENEQKVFESGKKAEYDAFWDSYQQNGSRENYYIGFSGNGWTNETFKPKYDIRPTSARQMFAQSRITDLKGVLQRLGVNLDCSNCTNFSSMFNGSSITHIGVIDTRASATANELLYGANVISVEKVILKDDGSQTFGSFVASESKNLEQIFFEGVIGQSGLNLRWSTKLSHDSIVSIINALSATTSDLTVTLSLDAVKKAFETSEGANDGNTSVEWKALTDTKKNWTISLV